MRWRETTSHLGAYTAWTQGWESQSNLLNNLFLITCKMWSFKKNTHYGMSIIFSVLKILLICPKYKIHKISGLTSHKVRIQLFRSPIASIRSSLLVLLDCLCWLEGLKLFSQVESHASIGFCFSQPAVLSWDWKCPILCVNPSHL